MRDNPATQPLTEPAQASAEDGLVIMDGPDGFAVTLTPEAARITGQRLIEAGNIAHRHRVSEGSGD